MRAVGEAIVNRVEDLIGRRNPLWPAQYREDRHFRFLTECTPEECTVGCPKIWQRDRPQPGRRMSVARNIVFAISIGLRACVGGDGHRGGPVPRGRRRAGGHPVHARAECGWERYARPHCALSETREWRASFPHSPSSGHLPGPAPGAGDVTSNLCESLTLASVGACPCGAGWGQSGCADGNGNRREDTGNGGERKQMRVIVGQRGIWTVAAG
ncbi:hypothetical protein EDB83DRAFT_2653608 [Lactarius deliciosus]|nr:hypothetical protein EDB83DRAFT_2653608 [Lactarius deliciosus]